MKTKFISFLLAFPLGALAQPVLTHNEFYQIGETVSMIPADTAGINIDTMGAGMNWHYGGLTANSVPYDISVLHDTSGAYHTSDVMLLLPDGTRQHFQENNTESYYNGYETPGGTQVFYSYFRLSRRPVHYLDTYTDTFAMNTPSTNTYSHGYIKVTADGYGTLTTPNGTYTNVMRIKKYQYEIDTTGSTYVLSIINSYQWYDTVHNAPLLRIDMAQGALANYTSVMYLGNESPAGVTNVNTGAVTFTANITNNQLYVHGNFTPGKNYDIRLLDLTGRQLLHQQFSAANTTAFDINGPVAAGMYIVWLEPTDGTSDRVAAKVVKQ